MARSRRRTPIISSMSNSSEKQDKRHANRNRNCRSALRDVSDPWAMAKDGRSWFGQHFPELMQK